MRTVTPSTTPRKVFNAHYYDEPGILFQHADGRILFLNEATDQLVTITPPDCNFLTVLGEVTLANDQRRIDRARGGAAAIATHRRMEVA